MLGNTLSDSNEPLGKMGHDACARDGWVDVRIVFVYPVQWGVLFNEIQHIVVRPNYHLG